jgi:5-methylthioadenosine/S-adenosylhomocysteine deaminase
VLAVDEVLVADWVLTVDAADRVVERGAVSLAGELIAAVGPAEEVLAAHPAAPVTRLQGHALLPGFVNCHTHLAMTMFRGLADDRDLDAFLATVMPAERRVLDAERVHLATRAAAVESVLAGVTTALDMYFFVDESLAAAAEVGLRLLTGPVALDAGGPDLPAPAEVSGDRVLRWAQRWLEQHPARPGWRPVVGPHATYTVSPPLLRDLGALAAEHGAVLHVHAAETDGECRLVRDLHGLRPVALLEDLGLLAPRTVLAHAVHLDDRELEAVAASGAAVAHCPSSNLKLASGVARVPELLRQGAVVGLGTDGPASSNDLDLLGAARLAALLHKGVGPGGRGDPTALPAAQVLRLLTACGAAAVGLGDELGSLEPGRRADVVAVDLDRPHTQPVYDPVSAVVYAAGRDDVRHVWSDGRRVVRDGEPVGVERSRVVSDLAGLRQVVAAALDA